MEKPKIRFKGYNDAWEQRKFGELVDKYEEPVETPTDGYMRLGIRSHAKGTFHSYVEKGKELETAKMFKVAANNFIVNINLSTNHFVYNIKWKLIIMKYLMIYHQIQLNYLISLKHQF